MTAPLAASPRLPALRHRDFRRLWLGQLVSTIGSQMQLIAVNWQVYQLLRGATLRVDSLGLHLDLSGQALGLGTLGLVRVVPIMLFALLGGVLADTHDRRSLILRAQQVEFLAALALAGGSLSGHIGFAALYTLTAVDASAAAFEQPAIDALEPMLVPREHLANAVSLATLVWTVGTIAGPALAGITIGLFPVGVVYAVNACSFAVVIAAVASLHFRDGPRTGGARVDWRTLVDGLKYTRRTPIIWSTMLLDFWATFFSSARTMLPIVAGSMLGVGSQGYGLLATAQPLGAVLTGTALSIRHVIVRQGMVLLAGVVLYGGATALFGLSTIFALSYALFFLTGAGDMLSAVIRANLRQTLTPNELRGRLSSVHMLLAFGGPQLGEVEAGLAAALFGVSFSLVSGGLATVAITGWVAWRYTPLRRYRAGSGGSDGSRDSG
ncbi:MAG: MFS transporter [Chloroflexota bacterium]